MNVKYKIKYQTKIQLLGKLPFLSLLPGLYTCKMQNTNYECKIQNKIQIQLLGKLPSLLLCISSFHPQSSILQSCQTFCKTNPILKGKHKLMPQKSNKNRNKTLCNTNEISKWKHKLMPTNPSHSQLNGCNAPNQHSMQC